MQSNTVIQTYSLSISDTRMLMHDNGRNTQLQKQWRELDAKRRRDLQEALEV